MDEKITTEQLSEIDLVKRIQDGDQQAEKELFRRHRVLERVEMMIRTRIRAQREDQNDLIGDVLLSILVNLRRGKFDPQKGVLGSYIWGIARNKIRDFLKPNPLQRQSQPIDDEFIDFRPSALERNALRDSLRAAIRRLDPRYQHVLLLRYYENLSISDIGEQLGLTQTQVYNRIHYALALIRNQNKDA